MNAILYITIFIIGTLFGSFYTLAVYRLPRKIDITHTHSFCPKCNHKLGFFELIPVFSYLFLRGRCKECKQKIRIRYFILEVLSGVALLSIALVMKLDIYNIDINKIIEFAFICLYLVAIFLIAGIEKENRYIEKSVLYYAVGISAMYIIYLCIMGSSSIYRYAMYLVVIAMLLLIDNYRLRNKAKDSYIISIILLLMTMLIITGEVVTICTVIATIIIVFSIILIQKLLNVLNKSKKKQINLTNNLHIGFYLGISNVLCYILVTFIKGL